MKAAVAKLRQLMGSVRGLFLWLFLLGMILTLAVASFLSYNAIYTAISRLNQQSAKAELKQIQSNLIGLTTELDRQMNIILLDSDTQALSSESYFTQLELIEKAQEYSNKADAIITNFPYVQSVYLYNNDGSYWASTIKNMRHYKAPVDTPIPAKIEGLIKNAAWPLSMVSGMTSSDFPVPQSNKKNTPIISVAKRHGSHVLVCNILENEISKTYEGIASNTDSKIRIINARGEIFSSADKTELSKPYSYFDELSLSQNGDTPAQKATTRIFWQPVPELELVIVNELKLDTYFREWSEIRQVVFQTFFIGLSITCLLFFLWISRVFKPLDKLIHSMGQAGRGIYLPLAPQHGRDELSSLVTHYNTMLSDMQQLEAENLRVEAQKRDSELLALRSQINPHFLYNTLNSIKWMALMDGNENVAYSITSLGKIIAPLFKINSPTCSLYDEIKIVEEYMEIMKMRCGQGINFKVQLEPGTEELLVLRFILQPLVENAIVHGLAPKGYKGNICIHAWKDKECLVIEISDDGEGMNKEAIEADNLALKNGNDTQGIGMMNTNRRIQLWYGASYGVTIYPSPSGGLCVAARFPSKMSNAIEKVDE
ncbi:MAG: histidine kinase [Christensenella sp.]